MECSVRRGGVRRKLWAEGIEGGGGPSGGRLWRVFRDVGTGGTGKVRTDVRGI